jgi:hypothetical protein
VAFGKRADLLQGHAFHPAILANGPMLALIWQAAMLSDAARQSFARSAERATLPAGVLFARTSLPSLQYPLQRIIHYPPALVKLRYEPI